MYTIMTVLNFSYNIDVLEVHKMLNQNGSESIKTIAVLTSGGDAPGMNAAVRAVVRTACENGMKVYGIVGGYKGLFENNMREQDMRSVCDIIHRGGTKLGSARFPEFGKDPEKYLKIAHEVCAERGIQGIVVIGGDGSFRGARDLSKDGIPCIAIPGTIDNDIGCSDYTIGFDTGLNTIKDMVDRLRDTIESHSRCSVVEVMGNGSGELTLCSAIAVGATAIAIPEKPFDFQHDIIEKIERTRKNGKNHFIVLVSEALTHRKENPLDVKQMAEDIERITGVESRHTILGHVQRGGSPTVKDRVVASRMGNKAVHLLMDGMSNRVVIARAEKIVDIDIQDALKMEKPFDEELYKTAMEISL